MPGVESEALPAQDLGGASLTIQETVNANADFAAVAASGSVVIVDYLKAILTAAQGTITYGSPAAKCAATGTITYNTPTAAEFASGTCTYGSPATNDTLVVDGNTFTKKPTPAAASGTITYGAPDNGDSVLVAGHVFTKVASSPEGNQFSSITELTALIQALSEVNATDNGTTITIVAPSNGTAGNSITLSIDGDNTGTLAVSGATLTGGEDDLTATQFSTIAQLTALVDAVASVTATDNGSVITIKAAARGTAGNSIAVSKTGTALTLGGLSGGNLAGGVAGDTVSVDGTTFTCVASAPGAAEFSAIAELTALVTALANVNATDNGTVVSIVAAAKGTAGNSIALTLGGANAGNMAVSGSGTLSGGLAGDTVTVAGTTFTCIDASPGAAEFSAIAELTALIQALATVNATDNGSVVTVVAASAGSAGNAITMAKTGAALGLSGATLAGGYDHLTITVNGTALVQGTAFTAETDNDTTASNLATAIAALDDVGATSSTATVTITASEAGNDGNAITLATSSTAAATVSGATLTGGLDEDELNGETKYTKTFGMASCCLQVAALTGTHATHVLKIYESNDALSWTASAIAVTGEGIAGGITYAKYVKAAVSTVEGGTSTVRATIHLK